MKSLKRKK